MNRMDSKRVDIDVDLERGQVNKENNGTDHSCRVLYRSWSGGLLDQSKIESLLSQDMGEVSTSEDVSVKNSEIIMEMHSSKSRENRGSPKGKKVGKEKLKKPKPSKPPRPPKGPSLDDADIKLIKEISEMTIRKHRRMERISALKKKKENNSSAKTNILALGVSVLFFILVVFHGLLNFRR